MVPICDVFESADLGLYGGFVIISGGHQTFRVPFMGLKGDYTKMNVLGSISYGSINKRANAPHFDFSTFPGAVKHYIRQMMVR